MTKKRTMNLLETKKRALKRNERLSDRKRAERCKRYTYTDCLCDVTPVPTGANGTTLYQSLMTGGMVMVVCTTNGVKTSGTEFLISSH